MPDTIFLWCQNKAWNVGHSGLVFGTQHCIIPLVTNPSLKQYKDMARKILLWGGMMWKVGHSYTKVWIFITRFTTHYSKCEFSLHGSRFTIHYSKCEFSSHVSRFTIHYSKTKIYFTVHHSLFKVWIFITRFAIHYSKNKFHSSRFIIQVFIIQKKNFHFTVYYSKCEISLHGSRFTVQSVNFHFTVHGLLFTIQKINFHFTVHCSRFTIHEYFHSIFQFFTSLSAVNLWDIWN